MFSGRNLTHLLLVAMLFASDSVALVHQVNCCVPYASAGYVESCGCCHESCGGTAIPEDNFTGAKPAGEQCPRESENHDSDNCVVCIAARMARSSAIHLQGVGLVERLRYELVPFQCVVCYTSNVESADPVRGPPALLSV